MTRALKKLFHRFAVLQRRMSYLSMKDATEKEDRIEVRNAVAVLVNDLRELADELEAHT